MAGYAAFRAFIVDQAADRQDVAFSHKTAAQGGKGDCRKDGRHGEEIEKNIAVFKKAVDGMVENG